jgi:hypothetical protein
MVVAEIDAVALMKTTKCITSQEASRWLQDRGQIEDPYTGECEPEFHLIFEVPRSYEVTDQFVGWFLKEVVRADPVLLVVTDATQVGYPSQDVIHDALRCSLGETRPFDDAPAYLIPLHEQGFAVALFSLATTFGWKCFLYGGHDHLALYNWAGEIFDLWTSSSQVLEAVRTMINQFGFPEMEHDPPDCEPPGEDEAGTRDATS